MAQSQSKRVDLFGGAIVAEIPSTFQDVSTIRQVPDNQEVYLDSEGFTSITFDILERVERESDVEALKFHLADVVDEDAGQTRLYSSGTAVLASMPGTPVLTLLATSPPGEKRRGRANEPEFVGILMALIRLEAQKTDVVVTVNVPHLPGSYEKAGLRVEEGRYGPLLEAAQVVKDKVLGSFEVRDWGLFVE
ncbi:hypothetical protein DOTSEDRAFT_74672 [Dothistroma septosporum NZE10]|uniref:Mog1p/PsbP-like protein n=1 Tax=Dothistroma septosporum (strain NZE10 / CBS 128990) TaxID=675120 RepID=N1PEY1_DOTSN|nr:hypothetical protein DOTSEDRAFT_74672 [Dothistroma septosporum NZE10]